jgi:hypothetical protein
MTVAFISACATPPAEKPTPPASAKRAIAATELPAQAKAGYALIYVIRPSDEATLIKFNVFLDNQNADAEMGYTQAAQYIYFYVKPGRRRIWSKAENWADLVVAAKPGEIIFLRQNPEVGYVISRNSLRKVDQKQGVQDLKRTSAGTILKTFQ